MDLLAMFQFEGDVREMLIRGTVVYWALFLLLRLAGRRDVGSLGVADLLVLLLVADAAGTAMTGDSSSITDGLVVVATIVGWSIVVDRLGYYFPPLRRVLEPSRVLLVADGRINRRGMQQEMLTRGELYQHLRLKGIDDICEVKRMYIESNGEISVLRK